MVFDDVDTFTINRVIPYANCMYKVNKISGEYNRDIREKEFQKFLKDCIVFKGLNNNDEMLDFVLQFKREP